MREISKQERKELLETLERDYDIKRDSEGNIIISEEDFLKVVKSFLRGSIKLAEELAKEK